MLKVDQLSYHYGKTQVLQLDHWEVTAGQPWVILGKSGSGKTTLLHLIGGLLRVQSGLIEMNGQNIGVLSPRQLDVFRAKNIGLVFQKPHLVATLTVMQNLLLAQWLSGQKQQKSVCQALLASLQMEAKLQAYPNQLSQGEAQRVAVARALLNRPQWLLADEPTASLDDENAAQVVSLLLNQAQEFGATLLIATHDERVKTHLKHCLDLNSLSKTR